MLVRDFSVCPRCSAPTKKATAFNNGESEFWYECTKCNTYINTYIPQEHQASVHDDTHRFLLNAGGYGSGKTTTSRQEFYKHLLLTPGGNTLIGANIAPQYEQTIKRDIENDVPQAFIKDSSSQKQYIDFINDHRVMFRPFDDPNKLRSYNLSMWIMVEASEIVAETFTQLKTRLRHMAATKPKLDKNGNPVTKVTKTGVHIPVVEADWRKGIIETNPDSGWVRSDVLLKSDKIYKHGNIPDEYRVIEQERDKAISTHITVSDVNEFLPPTFVEDVCKNKPLWWINRYIHGSFMYSDGLVYPTAMTSVCKTFDIPPNWKRIAAFDYGLSDDAVFLFGAVDQKENILYIYKELRVTNKSVKQLAELFHQGAKDIPTGGWITQPIIDPKSAPKRDYDKKSLSDHFLDYGISFKAGHISVDARVFRLNTYFESKCIKIMDCCTALIGELRDYKFKAQTRSGEAWSDKPQDKNNHGINALEWITMELPADPANLVYGVYDRNGLDVTNERAVREQSYVDFIFSDDDKEQTLEGPYDLTLF